VENKKLEKNSAQELRRNFCGVSIALKQLQKPKRNLKENSEQSRGKQKEKSEQLLTVLSNCR